MRKTFKHLAMAALASALIAGQATTAFAFKNDTNNGPGSGKSTEVSLQAPGDNSDSSQSSGNNTSPTTIVEESSQSTDTSQSDNHRYYYCSRNRYRRHFCPGSDQPSFLTGTASSCL